MNGEIYNLLSGYLGGLNLATNEVSMLCRSSINQCQVWGHTKVYFI